MNLTEINELIYATAAVIANEKIVSGGAKIQLRNTCWKERIQRVIDDCRKDLSYIKEFRNGNSYQKVETRMKTLLEKAALSTNQIDELEQNIIQRVIDDCRKDLSYIKEFRNGNSYQKVETRMKTLLEKAALSTNQIDELEQNITMKLQVKAQRLKRYSKRNDQFHQNRIFKNDAKKFYRQIRLFVILIKNFTDCKAN